MIVLTIVLVVAAIVIAVLLRGRSGGKAAALKQRYRQLRFLSEQEAAKALQYQLKAVRERHPGHTELWYLEKIVYDLEHDRR